MHNPSLSSACDSISDIWLTLIISWKLLDFLLFCGFYLRGSHDLNAWRAQRTRSRGRRGSSSFFNIISKRIWPFPSWSVLLAAWRGFLAHFGTVWLWYCTTGTVPGSVPGTVPLVLWLLYCIWYCDWYFTNSTVPGTVWLWYCSMGTVTLVLYWWGFLAPTVTLVLCLILCLVLYHFGTALYWWGFGTVPLVLCLVLYQWWDFGTVPGTLVLYHWWGFWRPLWLWYCAWYCAWYCITLVLYLVLWYCTIGEAFWRPLWQLNQPPLSPPLHSPAGIHGAAYFTNI